MLQIKKIQFIIIAFLLIPFYSSGQVHENNNLILTREDNARWLDSLQGLNESEIRESLSSRLLADTNTYILQSAPHGAVHKEGASIDPSRVRTECRPLVHIDDKLFHFNNSKPTDKIEKLAEMVREGEFKSLRILRDADAAAIYGTSGSCGVFIMETSSAETRQKLAEVGW